MLMLPSLRWIVFGCYPGIVLESGSCNNAFAGDYATLTLSGTDVLNLHVGDVLCDPVFPVISATRLRGRIALFVPKVPLIAGQECVFHNQSYTESCVIKKLNSQVKLREKASIQVSKYIVCSSFSVSETEMALNTGGWVSKTKIPFYNTSRAAAERKKYQSC